MDVSRQASAVGSGEPKLEGLLPVSDVGRGAQLLADLVAGRRWTVLSGAGLSTDSGIPDYRGPTSVRATPMQYAEFVGSAQSRRRYWARSYLGWPRMGTARPNAGHLALAQLERAGTYGGLDDLDSSGLIGVVTQNVDGLHVQAGSRRVIALHGELSRVVCLDCGALSSRAALQEELAHRNPGVVGEVAPGRAELRPDGDAVVHDWQDFDVPDCTACGGRLKPDVVFFGESVPKARVEAAYDLVDEADVLVVVGSSLTVMSGLRFVRHQRRRGLPVAIVNRGTTRGDELATVKLESGCSETLGALRALLAPDRSGYLAELRG